MPLYLCRWPNSDVSVVQARNKTEAIIRLDEFENAEGAQIPRLSDFLVDFHLNDEGRLEFGTFGEATEDEIMEKAYPELEELKTSAELNDLHPEGEEYAQKIKEAVEWERNRLWKKQKTSKQPQTEMGKRIQKRTGAATVLVDRWVEELGEKILEEFEPEGEAS